MKQMKYWKKLLSLTTAFVLVLACLFVMPVRAVDAKEGDATTTEEDKTTDENTDLNKLDDIAHEHLVQIQKVWLDGNDAASTRPASIDVTLTATGGNHEDTSKDYKLKAEEDWTTEDWAVRYDDQVFQLAEKEVPGYMTTITKEEQLDAYGGKVEHYLVTNTKLVQLSVEKVWVGDKEKEDQRPEAITVDVFQNGELFQTMTLAAPVYGGFIQVPQYDANDKPYEYTIKEHAVNGYESKVTLKVATEEDVVMEGPSPEIGEMMFTLTNTYQPEEKKPEEKKLEKTMPKTAAGVSMAAIIGLAASAAYMARKRR